MQAKVREIRRIKNILPLSETIYNNFIELKNKPELMHNKKEIIKLLKSDKLVCLFCL